MGLDSGNGFLGRAIFRLVRGEWEAGKERRGIDGPIRCAASGHLKASECVKEAIIHPPLLLLYRAYIYTQIHMDIYFEIFAYFFEIFVIFNLIWYQEPMIFLFLKDTESLKYFFL